MQIGDMVCYNVGGMKRGWKTMGILLDKKRIREGVSGDWHTFLKISWHRVGIYKPRPVNRMVLGYDCSIGLVKFLPMDANFKAKVGCAEWFRDTCIEKCNIN